MGTKKSDVGKTECWRVQPQLRVPMGIDLSSHTRLGWDKTEKKLYLYNENNNFDDPKGEDRIV